MKTPKEKLNEFSSIWKSIGKLEIARRRCQFGSLKWQQYDCRLIKLEEQAVAYLEDISDALDLLSQYEAEDYNRQQL